MNAVFADTSFYIAICNPRDQLHKPAVDVARDFRGTVITTEFVLIELGNWLSKSGDRDVFVRLVETLRDDPNCRIQPAEQSLFQRGYALYAARLDKDWSLTDCISIVVMQDEGLSEALTADHHFEQAGFQIALK